MVNSSKDVEIITLTSNRVINTSVVIKTSDDLSSCQSLPKMPFLASEVHAMISNTNLQDTMAFLYRVSKKQKNKKTKTKTKQNKTKKQSLDEGYILRTKEILKKIISISE